MSDKVEKYSEDIKNAQKAMYESAFDKALNIAKSILNDDPSHQAALYICAACLRYLKEYDQALTYIDTLKNAHPEFGRAFQEEGHTRLALGEKQNALVAFSNATKYNSTLIASWKQQVELYRQSGQDKAALEAQAQATRIAGLPKELVAVTHYVSEGRILKAEEIARAFMKRNPKHIEGMRLLADIGSRLSVYDDAEFLLESAVAMAPDNIQVRLDYVQVLRQRQKYEAALKQAKELLDIDPENPLFQSHYAIECMQGGDYEAAIHMFDSVLEKMPAEIEEWMRLFIKCGVIYESKDFYRHLQT